MITDFIHGLDSGKVIRPPDMRNGDFNGISGGTHNCGHEVMRMMLDSGQTHYTKGLVQTDHEAIRPGDALVRLLGKRDDRQTSGPFSLAKGKFLPKKGGFTTTPDSICDHLIVEFGSRLSDRVTSPRMRKDRGMPCPDAPPCQLAI